MMSEGTAGQGREAAPERMASAPGASPDRQASARVMSPERQGPPRWRFRVMSPSEINENPVQGEFFGSDLPKRFVRESIQNALDARAGAAAVRVRFAISGTEGALPPGRAAPYLNGLRRHFCAVVDAEAASGGGKDELEQRKSSFDLPMPFLVVEDFGTLGLQGDVRANAPQAKDNHFWGLFRSVGISPKGKDAGGSWGLGKWVFPSASKLNAFLGVTRRQDDDQLLLMGQAMLKLHELDGRKYAHYGYFAAASNEQDDSWLPMPASSAAPHAAFVRHAVADFGLADRDQAGTSVVVPHPEDELTDPDKLAWAVITQYFWPIVAGDLAVEIVAGDATRRTIDAETISREVHNCDAGPADSHEEAAESMAGAIELAAWGARAPRNRDVPAVADLKKAALPPAVLQDVRRRYERNERLAFAVKTTVRPPAGERPGSSVAAGQFRVFLEKDDALAKGHDYHVRGHLHIPGMDFLHNFQARALTLVDSRSNLGHLLRDSEGPAHDKWNAYAPRLKEKGWRAPALRVREAQRAAERILLQLVAEPEEKQRDALADLFPSKIPSRRAKSSGDKPPGGWDPSGRREPKPAPRIRGARGGIALTTEADDGLGGTTWTVRVAYDVARGSARTALSRFASGVKAGCPDFSFHGNRLSVEAKGCTTDVVADNELRVVVTEPEMSLVVKGFDGRDLLVDVVQVDTASTDGEEP